MRRFFAPLLLAGLAMALQAGDVVSPSITVDAGVTRGKDINAFGGLVIIAGKLDAAIFMIRGKLVISGEVSGDVICLGTEVEIRDSAIIGKDLWVISDRVQKAEKSFVGGRTVQVKNLRDLRRMASTILPFIPEESDISLFKFIKIIFWFILALIILAIFPDKVRETSENLPLPLLKLGIRGLIFYILFIILLALFFVLSLFLIGLPFLLVLMILYFIAQGFGRTVVFFFLGNAISRSLGIKKLNPTYYILLGILPYAAFKFIPYAGFALVMIMDFFVLGISSAVFLKRRSIS